MEISDTGQHYTLFKSPSSSQSWSYLSNNFHCFLTFSHIQSPYKRGLASNISRWIKISTEVVVQFKHSGERLSDHETLWKILDSGQNYTIFKSPNSSQIETVVQFKHTVEKPELRLWFSLSTVEKSLWFSLSTVENWAGRRPWGVEGFPITHQALNLWVCNNFNWISMEMLK